MHPAVKRIRLDTNGHHVTVGFYESPATDTLEQIRATVGRELSGDWNISLVHDGEWPALHLHKIDRHTAEIHRVHPEKEPRVIWKRIALPAWQNRPYPRAVPRDYRVMLGLTAVCAISALCGFLFQKAGLPAIPVAFCFVAASLSGGWFTTQEVWVGLKQRKTKVEFGRAL